MKGSKYVPLTPEKVKTKFKQFVKHWRTYRPSATQGTSSGSNLFDKYNTQFSSLFSDNEATSSGSVGVLMQTNKKKPTVPVDLISAVKYLFEHGCNGVDLFSCTYALQNETILLGFLAMRTYEERKTYITDLLEAGVVKPPSYESAKTPPGDM